MKSNIDVSDETCAHLCGIGGVASEIRSTINGIEMRFVPQPLSLPPEARAYFRAENDRRLKAKLLKDCAAYLTKFSDLDEPPKKEVLRARANKNLRQNVPVRIFNEAYQQVFNRRRGRPAKSK
jgi:hypothetical protein